MKKTTVNIVAIKDDWILQTIANRLHHGLPYTEWTERPTGRARLTYFINYAQATDERVSEIECALFTHFEDRVPAFMDKWQRVAKTIDVAVSMSDMYARLLTRAKVPTVVIPPGVDSAKFKQRPVKIGVVGKAKKTGRKGEDLIKKVMDIPGIEWRFTGSGWPVKSIYLADKDMPGFYQGLDYLLIASYVEGGPMCAIEALASGVPVISGEVGWVPELPHIAFKVGSVDSLRTVLESIVAERSRLREAVLDRSWENFIAKHDALFKNLLSLPKDRPLRKRIVRKMLETINQT